MRGRHAALQCSEGPIRLACGAFQGSNRVFIREPGKLGVFVDGLRLSTPTNPQGAPPLGWRHDGVVCVVLEFQSGNAILAQVQGTCLG